MADTTYTGAGTIIGLKDLHYALLTKDDETGVTYETPVKIAPAIEATINPNATFVTLFADDGPADAAVDIGDIDVTLNVQDLSLETQAVLLGHTMVEGSGELVRKTSDVPPYVAIGFKSQKSNGSYRYCWLLKGRFGQPTIDRRTKEGTINFQTATITGKFLRRDYDEAWIREADEDEGFELGTGKSWFDDVEPATVPAVGG